MTDTDPLATHAHRKVRIVAKEEGPHADELFRLAMGNRKHWTGADWRRVLDELDSCNQTIDEWRLTHE